ncbi:MAG: hypothetical protein ABR564_09435 [Candidatus Dormibacteria bacterium]
MRRRATPGLIATSVSALLTGCGTGGGASVTPAELGLAAGAPMHALASTTIHTSPDGGIYRNPDALRVVVAGRGPASPLDDRLGSAADWRPLRTLGALTFVGIQLSNDGKVGSDPRLNDLQVASDLAPDGTAAAPLRRFYHPMYPLAALADVPIGGDCTITLDPSQQALVVLVYPPLRRTTQVTWGRFGDFTLEFGLTGRLPSSTGRLHATACVPPRAPP